jgi:hypothetical protein
VSAALGDLQFSYSIYFWGVYVDEDEANNKRDERRQIKREAKEMLSRKICKRQKNE